MHLNIFIVCVLCMFTYVVYAHNVQCSCLNVRGVLLYHFLLDCLETGCLTESGAKLVTREPQGSSGLYLHHNYIYIYKHKKNS